MNYGLPYMGSKNGIAEWVLSKMPKREHLYDLFCGGCAITHAALFTNKFKTIHANDLNPASKLFIDAAKGKYHNETRWISRKEFERLKDKEPYVAYVWSFGNNMKGYLYSPQNERIKKALWQAIVFNDYSLADEIGMPIKRTKETELKKRRLDIMQHWKKYGVKKIDKRCELQSLESLERLQSLQSLERLERLQSLEYTNKSYNEVEIKENSLIYCDIPYKLTASYVVGSFNHEEFYEWAKRQSELVMISEYSMPKGFTCVAQIQKRNTLSTNQKAVEKLFVPDNQIELYNQLKQARK